MRFTVNLALAPRENRRRIWVVWGSLFALSFAALLVLGVATTVSWQAASTVRHRSAQLEAEMPSLTAQRTALTAALERPAAQDQLQRAQRLNALIARKAVSWTRLFERLEALMPAQVQLLSIAPAQSERQQGAVAITVATASIAQGLPFVEKLEQSGDFLSPQVQDVTNRQGQTDVPGAPVTLQITALYRPTLGPPAYFGHKDAAPARAAGAGRAR